MHIDSKCSYDQVGVLNLCGNEEHIGSMLKVYTKGNVCSIFLL